jgi:lambda family phage tail tape measure protein
LATQQIVIRISQVGAQQTAAGIAQIGSAARGSGNALDFLRRNLLGLTGAGFGARELLRAADAYTNLGNRTRVFAEDAADARKSLEGIIDVAFAARAPLDAVAEVFQRFSLVGRAAGKSTDELLRVTETLAKSVAVSGASAQEAEGALRQLAQGYGANRLSGQEFNSVAEQLPIIARLIANELGIATDQLRKFANEGKITREVIDRALGGGAEVIDALFARTAVTFGQAFTNLGTALSVFIGKLNETSGAGNLLTGALQSISSFLISTARDTDKLQAVIKILEAGFLALGVSAIPKAIAALQSFLGLLARAITFAATASLVNPFTALLTVLGAVTAALILFRDEVITLGEQETTVRDLAAVIGSDLVDALGSAIKSAVDFVGGLFEIDDAASVLPTTFNDFFNDAVQGFNILIRVAAEAAKRILNFFAGIGQGIADVVVDIPSILSTAGTQGVDAAGAQLAASFSRGFNDNLFQETDLNTIIRESKFDAGALLGGTDIAKRAAERTAARREEEARLAALTGDLTGGLPSPVAGGPPPIDPKTQKANDKLLEQFRALRGELDPTVALLNDYADKNKLLNEILAKFPDRAEEVRAAQALVNDEFNKAVSELPKETKEITELREAMAQLHGELDPGAQIAQEYATRLKEIGDAATKLGPGFASQAAELTRLATEAFTEAQAELKRQQEQLALESATGFSAIGAGFTLAAQDLTQSIQSQAGIIKDGFTDAFSVAGQAFKEFVETGKIDIRSLGSEILSVAAKAIAKLAVLSALNSLSGLAGGGGLAGSLGGFATSLLGARATGGPVSPGRSYLVGERGPELFSPPETGRVVPNEQLGMGGANVNVQVVNVDDPQSVPRALNSKAGEQAVLNMIQRNSRKLREVLA